MRHLSHTSKEFPIGALAIAPPAIKIKQHNSDDDRDNDEDNDVSPMELVLHRVETLIALLHGSFLKNPLASSLSSPDVPYYCA